MTATAALNDCGIHDTLKVVDTKADFSLYKLLILPDASGYTEEAIEKIKAYAKSEEGRDRDGKR